MSTDMVDMRFSRPAWDIAPRTGYWVGGDKWVSAAGRNADLYVLALHAVTDNAADHCDPIQWQYFVVSERSLPAAKSIGLRSVSQMARPVSLSSLAGEVEQVLSAFKSAPISDMEKTAGPDVRS